MTIKKWGLFLVSSAIAFCLCRYASSMVTAAETINDGTTKEVKMDLGNAIQHIESVKLIAQNGTSEAVLKSIWSTNLVGIKTNNFIISKSDSENRNSIVWGSNNSNILWWVKNSIKWSYSSILWGTHNTIWDINNSENKWDYSTILWWTWNTITKWSYSTILWWQSNTLKWNGSVIAWWKENNIDGDYSVTVWSNNTVDWNNSAALWTNSTVSADNSFLWTDGNHNETLSVDNVFAVVSDHGMVVNANKAHSLAQLTIWWPLIIDSWDKDAFIECNWSNAWVMKVVDRDEAWTLKCLCGCDGTAWHSLYGQWTCEAKCNVDLSPECGAVKRCNIWGKKAYKWTCTNWKWKAVQWNWAYLVTKDNNVHRTCQTDDWAVVMCAEKATGNFNTNCSAL